MEFSENVLIVSKGENVTDNDFKNIIGIIDENGEEINFTYDKFVEVFDTKGLSGFIM